MLWLFVPPCLFLAIVQPRCSAAARGTRAGRACTTTALKRASEIFRASRGNLHCPGLHSCCALDRTAAGIMDSTSYHTVCTRVDDDKQAIMRDRFPYHDPVHSLEVASRGESLCPWLRAKKRADRRSVRPLRPFKRSLITFACESAPARPRPRPRVRGRLVLAP